MRYWYYIQGDRQIGPVSETEFLALFQGGKLNTDTLVWAHGLKEWARASDIAELVPPEFNPPPALTPVPKGETTIPQIRPWIRYWARLFDTCATLLVMALIVGIVHPPAAEWNTLFFGMVLPFAYCFIEPIFFSMFGTTPGKALLGVVVRDQSGDRLGFGRALDRSLGVWFYGWGMCVPLVSLFTLLRSYKNLTQKKITTWDKEGSFHVSHQRIGLLRATVGTVLIVGLFMIMAILNSMAGSY